MNYPLYENYDVGFNHDHRLMPILDLNVWIEETVPETFVIMHTHYIKEVSSRLVMLESSSHSERMKVNVMSVIGLCATVALI